MEILYKATICLNKRSLAEQGNQDVFSRSPPGTHRTSPPDDRFATRARMNNRSDSRLR
jgi:hypothetical protein